MIKTPVRAPKAKDPEDEDWYANLLVLDRRKCLLLTHAGTLFTIFEPDVRASDLTSPPPSTTTVKCAVTRIVVHGHRGDGALPQCREEGRDVGAEGCPVLARDDGRLGLGGEVRARDRVGAVARASEDRPRGGSTSMKISPC